VSLGTIVVDEVIFRIKRVRIVEGKFILDAETKRGDSDFGGGLVDCTVFGSDGLEVLSLRLSIAKLHTRDGKARISLPVHIYDVSAA
jgi:hypothetical protein